MTEYLVPYESAESEFEEKRSRFISHVFLVESEAEARARIDEMKRNTTTRATIAGASSCTTAPFATATTASRRARRASRC